MVLGKVVPEGWAVTAQPSGTTLIHTIYDRSLILIQVLINLWMVEYIFISVNPILHGHRPFYLLVLLRFDIVS